MKSVWQALGVINDFIEVWMPSPTNRSAFHRESSRFFPVVTIRPSRSAGRASGPFEKCPVSGVWTEFSGVPGVVSLALKPLCQPASWAAVHEEVHFYPTTPVPGSPLL